MDKITIFLKYTGALNFSSRAKAMENLISVMKEHLDYVGTFGNTDNGERLIIDYTKLWWHIEDEFLIKLFWYTTNTERAVSQFTTEMQELLNLHNWGLTINIEQNKYPGVYSNCFFGKFEIFNSISADYFGKKTLDFPDGRYDLHNQTITQWRHDGHICSMTDYDPDKNWHRNYYLHATSPLRFSQIEYSTVLDIDDNAPYECGYYYEMSRPNNEIGSSFQEDLDHDTILLNEESLKEFIDQIYLTFPYVEKMHKGAYTAWPNNPITLDSRFRDSKGYYFVLFVGDWTCTHTEWTENQVNYLRDLLDHTPKYTGDRDAILAYAREKWIIQ